MGAQCLNLSCQYCISNSLPSNWKFFTQFVHSLTLVMFRPCTFLSNLLFMYIPFFIKIKISVNVQPTITPVLSSYWQIIKHNCSYNRSGTYRQQVKVHRQDRPDNHILTLNLMFILINIWPGITSERELQVKRILDYLFWCCVACCCALSIVSVVATLSKLKFAAAGTELAWLWPY